MFGEFNRPWLKEFHRCPLKTYNMNACQSLLSNPTADQSLLAEDSSTLHQSQIMNHRLEQRRATQVIRVATKANALHQCHRSFPRCSSNMQPGSADFPLLLSITRHQPFSSQTIDTQQGETHVLRARVYLWAIHIWWRGTGHHWHAASFRNTPRRLGDKQDDKSIQMQRSMWDHYS